MKLQKPTAACCTMAGVLLLLTACGQAAAPTTATVVTVPTAAPTPTLSGEPTTTLTGRWVGTTRITLDACIERDSITMELQEAAGVVEGLYTWSTVECTCCGTVTGSRDPVKGSASGGEMKVVTGGRFPNWTYSSKFDDAKMTGTVKGPNGQDRGTWEAHKE